MAAKYPRALNASHKVGRLDLSYDSLSHQMYRFLKIIILNQENTKNDSVEMLRDHCTYYFKNVGLNSYQKIKSN